MFFGSFPLSGSQRYGRLSEGQEYSNRRAVLVKPLTEHGGELKHILKRSAGRSKVLYPGPLAHSLVRFEAQVRHCCAIAIFY